MATLLIKPNIHKKIQAFSGNCRPYLSVDKSSRGPFHSRLRTYGIIPGEISAFVLLVILKRPVNVSRTMVLPCMHPRVHVNQGNMLT